jgi:hypothetical protein
MARSYHLESSRFPAISGYRLRQRARTHGVSVRSATFVLSDFDFAFLRVSVPLW